MPQVMTGKLEFHESGKADIAIGYYSGREHRVFDDDAENHSNAIVP
jgi:hypothetical protein